MPSLASLETRWIELFDELCRSHSIDGSQIAAPFFSVPADPCGFASFAAARQTSRIDPL
jgi:hypothetical protein